MGPEHLEAVTILHFARILSHVYALQENILDCWKQGLEVKTMEDGLEMNCCKAICKNDASEIFSLPFFRKICTRPKLIIRIAEWLRCDSELDVSLLRKPRLIL